MKLLISSLFLASFAISCGKAPSSTSRVSQGSIVGGREIEYNTNDEIASASAYFKTKKGATCSGVVIANRVVLTAAHCLEKSVPEAIHVGEIRLNRFPVKKTIIHKDYNPKTLANDLGLIILESNIEMPFRPIRILDSHSRLAEGTPLTVAGFSPFTRNQRQDIFEALSYKIMYDYTEDDHRLRKQTVLAFESRNRDPKKVMFAQLMGGICPGDSGGPTFIHVNGRPFLYAINSFISSHMIQEKKYYDCEMFGASSIVASYRSWIEEEIRGLQGPQFQKTQVAPPAEAQKCGQAILDTFGLFEQEYLDNSCKSSSSVTSYLQGLVDDCRKSCSGQFDAYVHCRFMELGIRKFVRKAENTCSGR